MKRNIFILIVLLLALSAVFCACFPDNTGNSGNHNDNTDKNDDANKDKNDGWEDKIVELQDMYIDFLSAFLNVAYEASSNKIDVNKQITGDIKFKFSVNDNDFWLACKGKYDETDPSKIREKAIMSLDLTNDESMSVESKLLSACIYNDELYIAIGTNKVKFSLANSHWTEYFPYEMENYKSDDLKTIATALSTIIKFKEDPVVKYRRNSTKEEYKYSLNINLKETLISLLANLNVFIKAGESNISIQEIKNLVSSVLGITLDELNEGKIPDSSLTLDYYISGKKIADLLAKFELDISGTENYLIDEDTLVLELDMENVEITNDWNNGVKIDFVTNREERESYQSYGDAIYDFSIPIDIYDDSHNAVSNNHSLNIMTRVFQDDNTENFVFCEYYNTELESIDKALYVYKNKAYIYSVPENGTEAECVYRFDIDLSEIAKKIISNDLGGEKTLDIYALIAYLLGNITINEEEIRLAITPDFFDKVWYNFSDLVNYVDEESGILDNEETIEFIEFITTTEILFSLEYENENLLTIIEEDSKRITNVIAKLEYADDKFAEEEQEQETSGDIVSE